MRTIDKLAASLGVELTKIRTSLAAKVQLPTYLEAVTQTQYLRNPRCRTSTTDWAFTNGVGTREGASAAQWSYKTVSGAKSVVSAAGTATVAVAFKPSNAMNALGLSAGATIPVYLEVWIEGATTGTTQLSVEVAWYTQTVATRVYLLAAENVVNKKLYRIRGNWLWPTPEIVTAAGTNNVNVTTTLLNAPAGATIRVSNASIGPGVTKPFDGDTPDTALTQFDWTGTAYASESTRRPKIPGIGTKMLVDNGTWQDIPAGGGGGATTMDGITDATVVGKAVVRAVSQAAGRTAIDAASPADITAAINSLVTDSPALLNTLGELADALGDDPDFAATITAALAARVRTDTATQGLTGTQKTNARTNTGSIGTLAELQALITALVPTAGGVATMPYAAAAALSVRPALPANWAWRVDGGLITDPVPAWIVAPDWQDTNG